MGPWTQDPGLGDLGGASFIKRLAVGLGGPGVRIGLDEPFFKNRGFDQILGPEVVSIGFVLKFPVRIKFFKFWFGFSSHQDEEHQGEADDEEVINRMFFPNNFDATRRKCFLGAQTLGCFDKIEYL